MLPGGMKTPPDGNPPAARPDAVQREGSPSPPSPAGPSSTVRDATRAPDSTTSAEPISPATESATRTPSTPPDGERPSLYPEPAETRLERLELLHRIGLALSSERHRDRLLETILEEAQKLCHADGRSEERRVGKEGRYGRDA